MNNARDATSPRHSVTVMASAGTGKTWLLVSRLVRLLLEGAAPDSILAITFTRKAAAEMAVRLTERLHELARMDDNERGKALLEIGLTPTDATLRMAADLYEKRLFALNQVRASTFHAFCQELLRRFPLEADVPAGFELLESARHLQETAWDALIDEATHTPDSPVAKALENLFRDFSGHQTTKSALLQFLHHRSDWWAFTQGEDDPLRHAITQLTAHLNISPDDDPLVRFFSNETNREFREFAALLQCHSTVTNVKHADRIMQALDVQRANEDRLADLQAAFFTQKGERLKRKESNPLRVALGPDRMQRLLKLHDLLCDKIEGLVDVLRRHSTLALSQAWYRAGIELLVHYQRLKAEQRILDFSDLEWKAYVLLNHADHALWVQYKLDQRIDHLLIDEFQDTNPTQWQLIFPLLQELAAGESERQRTVFLVGDTKQSIYRFRRAEPDLFPAAQQWLHRHLHAVDQHLSASWRSSPAIIEFVNRIFENGPLHDILPEYSKHTTHRGTLWGQVEILPLAVTEESAPLTVSGLRNPLQKPRALVKDQRHHQEGRMIAERIQNLVATQTPIERGNGAVRPLRHDDIMILIRNRTHVHAYEEALRVAGIPYITSSRGTLLDCIEIRDMVALLEFLIVPYNNLSLATVLRSPLFECSDEDLIRLAAQAGGSWLECLLALAPQLEPDTPLERAARWLPRWQFLAGQRPVHDLLDCIYSEGNVISRYSAAFPAHLRPRVRANLIRFVELALEMDSGRYPSLTAFLNRLDMLKTLEDDAPDEAAESIASGSVRLLTIHAAKGLEAPVIFLADAATATPVVRAYRSLVRWPAQAQRPSHFLFCGKTSEMDTATATLVDEETQQQQREQIHLLYVALTRAKQLLFISGCMPLRGQDLGWYGVIASRLGDTETVCQAGWSASFGKPETSNIAISSSPLSMTHIPAGLNSTLKIKSMDLEIAPSRHSTNGYNHMENDRHGRERGVAIHRFLQLLSDGAPSDSALLHRVSTELKIDEKDPSLEDWRMEAEQVVNNPVFRDWFDASCYDDARNEIPVCYGSGERLVHGVVDRLVIKGDTCTIIDYKTQKNVTKENLGEMAVPYREQLRLYVEGLKRLWPGKRVRAYLLFTACAGAHEWRE